MKTRGVAQVVSEKLLADLTRFSSPTISNAVELLGLRRCDEGYTRHPVRCMVNPAPVVAGYACTALIRTSAAEDDARRVHPFAWWDLVLSVPAPRIVVMQDLDFPACRGSFWGEVQGNIHRALGCRGVVTDGFVRDVPELNHLGLLVLATGVTVSRCYPRLLTIGEPVQVMGAAVKTGELVHADAHGLVVVPEGAAADVGRAAAAIEEQEREIIGTCRRTDFSLEELKEAYARFRR
jgi:regulator of RNase E activity RraA